MKQNGAYLFVCEYLFHSFRRRIWPNLAFGIILTLSSYASSNHSPIIPASVIQQANIPYPQHSKEIGEEGTTWIKVYVSKDGKAEKTKIVKKSESSDLDEWATQVAMQSQYKPAKKHGVAIASALVLPITAIMPEVFPGNQKQIDSLKQMIASHPKDFILYEQLGATYLREQRWTEAQKTFLKVVSLIPSKVDRGDSLIMLGDSELALKEYSSSQEAYQQALQLTPLDPHATAGLAKSYIALGKNELALPLYEITVKQNPNDPILNATLGDLLLNMGRTHDSVPFLEKARQLDPQNTTALQDLGYVYFEERKYDEAVDAFQKITHLQPNNAVLLGNLGNALYNAGKPDEAVMALSRAIALFEAEQPPPPMLSDAYLELGTLLLKSGDNSKALDLIQKASKLNPHDPMTSLMLAKAYDTMKEYGEGFSVAKALVLDFPAMAEAHEELGNLYYETKERKHAMEEWQNALDFYQKADNKGSASRMEDYINRVRDQI